VTDSNLPWTIAPDVPLQAVLDDPARPPLLASALTGVLAWQTRNETTVHRGLLATRIAPQFVASLLALGATVTLDGEGGSEELPLEALLEEGRVREASLLRVYAPPGTRWGEARVARTPTDAPIVAAFALVELANGTVRQARVALTGAWREPARLAEAPSRLVGNPFDPAHIAEVGIAVCDEVAPVGDFRGSEAYRRAMAGVVTRRALCACLRRNGGADE
jgi:CO/xanthine dehydrogenase FAD-binding subunit